MKGHGVRRHLQGSSRHACAAGLATLLALSSLSASRACGYHDNVSIARGILNWVYPDALHVIGAISSAVAQKQLSHRDSESVAPGLVGPGLVGPGLVAPSLFGSQYHTTVKALERFAELLGGDSDDAQSLSFSLVLVEPMLWTHFEIGPRGPRAQVHVSGPQPDHLVLVSGQDVIHAIANEGLGIGEAHRRGLIRLYGAELQIARFRDVVRDVGAQPRSPHDQTLHMRDHGSRLEPSQ
jgi:hypothetical protein